MNIDPAPIIISISSIVLGGIGTAIVNAIRDSKKEKIRQKEREQDHLKIEVKDLKLALYKVERDLTEWKDKYYNAIQELISVKSELEETLIKLSFIDHKIDDMHKLDTEF
jgi:predicted RNase H-like nuclease (RuvC/YqgF family)